ncbi:MAG: ATP-binding protein [Acidobacteriota bacterium]|nr:ATP-binding protein [Acidobacteriota bacterium]
MPPVLDSVPAARRWVDNHLRPVADDIRRTVGLLTSELVTNAVLHAASPVTVTVHRETGAIRVEVADESSQLPTLKSYGEDAATGRGLHLVSALADSWGSRLKEEGKVVWFELGDRLPGRPATEEATAVTETGDADAVTDRVTDAKVDATADADAGGAGEPGTSLPPLLPMALLGAPVALLLATQALYEELFREFRLFVERDPGAADSIHGRLLDLVEQLGTRFGGFTTGADEDWRRAVDAGQDTVDLHYRLPAEVGTFCVSYDALLDEADAFCRAGALMTLAASEETRCLRKWVLEEIALQSSGASPTPWARSTWAQRLATQASAD